MGSPYSSSLLANSEGPTKSERQRKGSEPRSGPGLAKRTLPYSDIPCLSISIPCSAVMTGNTSFSPPKMSHLYAEAQDVVIAPAPLIA